MKILFFFIELTISKLTYVFFKAIIWCHIKEFKKFEIVAIFFNWCKDVISFVGISKAALKQVTFG